jgi:lysine 6-dehydrogenase
MLLLYSSFDSKAKAAGITLIPDCGQVPGLGTSLCAYAMTLLDEPRDILLYDGGIPLHPRPPLELHLNLQY